MGVRTTSGTRTWSSNIARNFAIPLTVWSKPSAMKSPNMISRIGRHPRRAMPAATPKIAPSETGVVITRCGHFVERPCVTLNAPPYGSRTSSPRR